MSRLYQSLLAAARKTKAYRDEGSVVAHAELNIAHREIRRLRRALREIEAKGCGTGISNGCPCKACIATRALKGKG